MFSKLGRFEIKEIIGRGAMGEVYLGVDPVLGREVAIKTIISSALPEDQARQRFDREAKAAAVLNSPNIVTIHELGEDQGVLFIAMERLKGKDLEQILLEKSLTLVESLEVLAQVCDGLDAAHRNHIIHRDIKPSNVMVMREGRKLLVKLMDFGVARLKDSAMTMVGTVIGTVNYIAPEYIRSGEPDARSDLFAVGVMLYECIAGRKPFEGGSASTVLFKIVNDPPDPLDLSMLQGLNPVLRNMTEKALAKDPDDRFQSAEEFALVLRAAKDPTWNGRLEETTVRMRIQPMLAAEPLPVVESLANQTLVSAVPKTTSSSPGSIASPVSEKSAVVAPIALTQEVVISTTPPAAETEMVAQPQPASTKDITQDVAGTPSQVPVDGSQENGAEVVSLPWTSEQIILSQPPAALERPRTPTPFPAAQPRPEGPATPKPVSEPCAAQTVVLKLPQVPDQLPPRMPATPVPPIAEVAESQVGTQEIVVKPPPVPSAECDAAKTVVLKLPLAPRLVPPIKPFPPPPVVPVAESQVGTQEIVVRPLSVPSGESDAAKTVILKLPLAPGPVAPSKPPTPAPSTAESAASKAGTQEIVVTPPPVPSGEYDATKTVVLNLPLTPEPVSPSVPSTPAPSTPEAVASKAGTQEIVVTPPPVPEIQTAKTEVLALAQAPDAFKPSETLKVVVPEEIKPLPMPEETQICPGTPYPSGSSISVESSQSPVKPIKTPKQEAVAMVPATGTEVPANTPASRPSPDTKREKIATPLLKVEQPAEVQTATSEISLPSSADESTRKTPSTPDVPPPSGKGPNLLILGLIALALLAGLGYFLFKSRAVPSPSVPLVSPVPSLPPETTPPPSLPTPQVQAPPPEAPQPKPSAGRVKPSKTPVKTPPPLPITPEPTPVPVVVVPPPPPPVVAPPPPPVLDEKAKKKLWAAEATRKRLEQEDHSRK